MIGLFAAASTALALLDEAIAAGRVPPPESEAELLAGLEARWQRTPGVPLSVSERALIERTAKRAWARATMPRREGVVVEDPFATRRASADLAAAWPESAAETPGRSRLVLTLNQDWLLPFSDVRRRVDGYEVPRDDADALAELPAGSLLGDDVAGARLRSHAFRPYWQVIRQRPGATEVVPFGDNPLRTGVGAGGAEIGAFDLAVASGEYGRSRLARATEALRSGKARIEDVVPLLDGHVPMRMGPNGAEGGWYNVRERASHGGRAGLDPESMILRDARRLVDWGFAVPQGALTWPPTISEDAWNRWIAGPPQVSDAEAPPGWLAVLRRRTERGRYRYDNASLAQLAVRIDAEALRTRLDRDLKKLLTDPAAYAEEHPYGPKTPGELIRQGLDRLDRQATEQAEARALDLLGEDSRNPDSVLRQLYHPERRVSVRAARQAIQHAAIEALRAGPRRWPKALHDWVRWGKGDYLGYEAVLDHFALEDDREGLRLGLFLADPDNRRRAVGNLARLEVEPVLELLRSETDPAVLRGIVMNLKEVRPEMAFEWVLHSGLWDRLPQATGETVHDYQVGELQSSLRDLLWRARLDREAQAPYAARLEAMKPS